MNLREKLGVQQHIKRFFGVMILIVGISVPVFAAGQEHWLFSGLDYDFTIFSSSASELYDLVGDDNVAYFNSLGFDVSWYGFLGHDNNVGMYTSLGFLFPLDNMKNQEQSLNTDPGDSGTTRKRDFVFSILLGPAFRHRCTDDLDMYLGIGFSFAHHTTSEADAQKTTTEGITSLGAGMDAGFKLDVTGRVCFRVGASCSYDFAMLYTKSVTTQDSQMTNNAPTSSFHFLNGFTVNPYIGIGIVLKTKQERIEPQTISLAALHSSWL